MIVYSCADRNSFRKASQILKRLKEETGSSKTVMIVANKVDLVRKRQVNSDGRSYADICLQQSNTELKRLREKLFCRVYMRRTYEIICNVFLVSL